MIKAAFIGAGRRARSAHYPIVSKLTDVRLEAVSDLDPVLMTQVAKQHAIPETYADYRQMLEAIDLDLIYVIMGEEMMTPIAIECMNLGKHVFIEKPAGASPQESRLLVAAAKQNDVVCAVGFQRRFAAVTREAMRLISGCGGATLAVGEFHKNMLGLPKPPRTTLWNDVCHAVDLIRWMARSEVAEATAFQDFRGSDWPNDYTALMRFQNGAVGVLLANRSSGGRSLRAELHGIGVGCFMNIPDQIEILERDRDPRTEHGADLAGMPAEDTRSYDGVLEMHRHLATSVAKGSTPVNDIRDVIHTSELVARLEGDSPELGGTV